MAGALASCAEPLVDDTFTPDQWAALKKQFTLPQDLPTCPPNFIGVGGSCGDLAALGQSLFFDSTLSGDGKKACADCHDATNYYIDDAPYIDNLPDLAKNVSAKDGGGFTTHNALGLTNIVFKDALVEGSDTKAFAWFGNQSDAQGVLLNATLPGAMHTCEAASIASVKANHLAPYEAVFGELEDDSNGSGCGSGSGSGGGSAVERNVAIALDGFIRQLISVKSPFDRFVAGDDSALNAKEQHGFAIFAGVGICIECHDGPLLTDLERHSTGVSQGGQNVPSVDTGDADGLYLTPSLRNVEKTPPYMHAGQVVPDLASVVTYYRQGGGSGGSGEKDPRIVPLDISDEDAADLVLFLKTLTGTPACNNDPTTSCNE